MKKYTDEFLLEELRRYYKETGKVPGYRDFDHNSNYPSSTPYKSRFNSWTNALKLVGMESCLKNTRSKN